MDDYYDKLPFVLDREQYNQEFLVLGTGLLECLLAAHLTKIKQRKGIVIDTEKTYGSAMKTLSLREFHEAASEKSGESTLPVKMLLSEEELKANTLWYEEKRASNKFRGYSIDLQPRFFFGSSTTCQLMKDADMDKYMDFRMVSSILFLHNGELQHVPLSKSTIFESKALSLFEKRQLLKTLHAFMKLHSHHRQIESDVNSTNEFDKDHQTDEELFTEFQAAKNQFCIPFLRKVCNNNDKIAKMLAYVILGYGYDFNGKIPEHAQHEYTTEAMVDRFGRFVRSCGIYGETPYLYVDNGIGDIPQAFSRIASIFGTVFILHPKVELQSVVRQEDGYHVKTNLCPEGDLIAKELYVGLPFVRSVYDKLQEKVDETKEYILRSILICKKNVTTEQRGCPAICHLYDLKEELLPNPIAMMMLDNVSSSCPPDEIVLSLETIVPQNTALASAADRLVAIANRLLNPDNAPDWVLYTAKFCHTNSYFQKDQRILQGGNWAVDLDEVFDAFKERVGPAEHYFKNEANLAQHDEDEEPDYYESLVDRLDRTKATPKEQPEVEKETTEVETIPKPTVQAPVFEEKTVAQEQKKTSQPQKQIAATQKTIGGQSKESLSCETSEVADQQPPTSS